MTTSKSATKPSLPSLPETYLLHTRQGTIRKVTVPPGCKITFGPSTVPRGTHPSTLNRPWTVRIYEAKERQIAVFTDVVQLLREDVQVEEREHPDVTVADTERRLKGLSNPPGTPWQHMRVAKLSLPAAGNDDVSF